MTDKQWQILLAIIKGENIKPIPVGFIIDSPWIPNWAGISIFDYFSNPELWFLANVKVIKTFPEVLFFPGFWSEYGMCSEPSSFGSRCIWGENEFPFAEKVLQDIGDVSILPHPDVHKDGLLPFIIKRPIQFQKRIEEEGHKIRFAVSRGPLNIASFLMGSTDFLIALKIQPKEIKFLLKRITNFIIEWLWFQKKTFSSIDGIFLLDDMVGFLGESDFCTFALPFLTKIFHSLGVSVKFFHNDTPGMVSVPYLKEIGINLYNFSFQHSLQEMKEATRNEIVLLGNIPPREVMAEGTPQIVAESLKQMLDMIQDKSKIILSCGGGMPPGVPTKNIIAFLETVKRLTKK
jgi:uroporphyrinogen decarboxylase